MHLSNKAAAGSIISTVMALLICLIPLSASASKQGFLVTKDGSPVLNGKGECWQTAEWDTGSLPENCGGKVDGDADGDGVLDSVDQCPGTPNGVAVDATGCPLDSDGDGVADVEDQCPGTPNGVAVDATGCPLDSDGDGVYDYLDKCPGTPAGRTVDADGCEINFNISGEVLFDTNSATLRPEAYSVLDNLFDQLARSGVTQLNIIGHTDSRGSEAYNQRLSERRAQAVRQYLINKGANANGISASGMGERAPVANNNNREGMQLNRRVEFDVLN